MSKNRILLSGVAFAVATFVAGGAIASTLWVGYDTQGPVERFTTSGAPLGAFGMGGATGTALDGAYAYTVHPSFPDSVITKYDASQNVVATIHFTSGLPVGDSWIEDLATGAGGTLWLSGYDGHIYNIDNTGAVLTTFDAGHTFSGIEVVGSSVYTTGGFDNGNIYQYDLSGNLVSTITTSLTEIGGLAYDPSDNTFWAGDYDRLNHLSITGATLGSLSLPGAFHDGLAIGDLTAVPEPSTWSLMLVGFGAMGSAMRRGRRRALLAA
jgi:hypothetical protein